VDLLSAQQKLTVRVAEAGPFLAMKLPPLDAARRRGTLSTFSTRSCTTTGEPKPLWNAFGEEIRAGNAACADAVACLNQFFRGEQSSTPVRAASFVLGPFAAEESEALRFRRLQIQQDMVDAGRLLRAAAVSALA
jgi:hypothetical protein